MKHYKIPTDLSFHVHSIKGDIKFNSLDEIKYEDMLYICDEIAIYGAFVMTKKSAEKILHKITTAGVLTPSDQEHILKNLNNFFNIFKKMVTKPLVGTRYCYRPNSNDPL